MNDVVKHGISAGKDPMGLAAAVLYTSCIKTGEQKSQIDLAKAAQTAEATFRIRVKDLKNRLELNEWAFWNKLYSADDFKQSTLPEFLGIANDLKLSLCYF